MFIHVDGNEASHSKRPVLTSSLRFGTIVDNEDIQVTAGGGKPTEPFEEGAEFDAYSLQH